MCSTAASCWTSPRIYRRRADTARETVYGSGMITLHGFTMSPNTRRVWLMLEELGVPYEVVPVDLMTGEHKGDPYRALNPTMRVPTLIDGDFVLWESNAILEYLADHLPDAKLGPQTARERGDVARWMFMNAAHLSPSIARIFAHTIRLPEDQRLPRIVEEGRADVARCLVALESQLEGKEYVVGRYTIADISIAASLSAAPMLGIDLTKTPNVDAWMKRMSARPAWKKIF
jgi:glutathione S-transferase